MDKHTVPAKCTIPKFSQAKSDVEELGMEIEHIGKKIAELNRELIIVNEPAKIAKLHEERDCYIDELKKREKLNSSYPMNKIADITKVNIDDREKSKGQELLEYLESVRKPISHELDIPASDVKGPKFTEEEKVPHTSEKGIRSMLRHGKIF